MEVVSIELEEISQQISELALVEASQVFLTEPFPISREGLTTDKLLKFIKDHREKTDRSFPEEYVLSAIMELAEQLRSFFVLCLSTIHFRVVIDTNDDSTISASLKVVPFPVQETD